MKNPTTTAIAAEITQPATFPYMFTPLVSLGVAGITKHAPRGGERAMERAEFPAESAVEGRLVRARSPFFHDRLAHDLFDRGDAVVDREQPALAERAHAALLGLQAEDLGAGVLDDLVAHLVVEQHDLVDALPAPVAAVVAVIATLAVIEDLAGHVLRL